MRCDLGDAVEGHTGTLVHSSDRCLFVGPKDGQDDLIDWQQYGPGVLDETSLRSRRTDGAFQTSDCSSELGFVDSRPVPLHEKGAARQRRRSVPGHGSDGKGLRPARKGAIPLICVERPAQADLMEP